MGDTTDEQVLGFLRAGMRPNALKNKFSISVARSKRVAAEHGIDLVEIAKRKRDGSIDDLYTHLLESERSVGIPVRMQSGAQHFLQIQLEVKILQLAALPMFRSII
jgi:hypothetical protein